MFEENPNANDNALTPRAYSLGTLRTHMLLGTVASTTALLVIVGLGAFVPLFVRLGSATHLDAEVLRVADHLLFLHENFWPVAVVALVAPCVSCYVLYRRMTRPLIRVRRVFAEIERGHVPRAVALRQGDYLAAEVEALNLMLESLRVRTRALESAREDIAGWVEQVAETGAGELDAARIEQLRARHKDLDEQLGWLTSD